MYDENFQYEFDELDEELDSRNLQDKIGEIAIYGTDWTVETIVGQINKDKINLNPEFQRRDAWTIQKKSKFVESLMLGIPVPQLVLAEKFGQKGNFIVIDGKQRLLSLCQFIGDSANRRLKLKGLEIKKELNGMDYKALTKSQYSNEIDAFLNQPIRTVVIKNCTSVEVLYLIFYRLNTGSVKLSPQELRQALYPGKFVVFANKKAGESLGLKKILNLKSDQLDFRMRDVELFVRYIAFRLWPQKYSGSMQMFLDGTCEILNRDWDSYQEVIGKQTDIFEKAICLVYDIFGEYAFCKFKNSRYERKFNRAIADIMLYYFSDSRIAGAIERCEFEKIRRSFEDCCQDVEFLQSLETTTKSMTSVSCRFNKWASSLSKVLQEEVDSPFSKV